MNTNLEEIFYDELGQASEDYRDYESNFLIAKSNFESQLRDFILKYIDLTKEELDLKIRESKHFPNLLASCEAILFNQIEDIQNGLKLDILPPDSIGSIYVD